MAHPLQDPVASQAIEWMVVLRSGTATARDRSDFEGWRRASPLHEAACQRIERVPGRMEICAVDVASRQVLRQPVMRSRLGTA